MLAQAVAVPAEVHAVAVVGQSSSTPRAAPRSPIAGAAGLEPRIERDALATFGVCAAVSLLLLSSLRTGQILLGASAPTRSSPAMGGALGTVLWLPLAESIRGLGPGRVRNLVHDVLGRHRSYGGRR